MFPPSVIRHYSEGAFFVCKTFGGINGIRSRFTVHGKSRSPQSSIHSPQEEKKAEKSVKGVKGKKGVKGEKSVKSGKERIVIADSG